ncbi:mitochondrial carrier domain-containing protein [Mrakia frigida]|uniref:mitochondrial carrier domain-containing protein n=1 Tax=Mrakia frigida TaxID=29902 RepID=UPI003FCC0C21
MAPVAVRDRKALDHLTSGAASGLASSVLLQPLDLLKTRIQQQGGTSKKVWHITKNVVKDAGVRGLWRGTAPTVVRNVPGVAAYFYTLSEIRYALAQLGYFSLPIPIPLVSDPSSSNQSTTSTLPKLSREGNLLAGAIARTGVGFVMNPVTVLKARYESNLYSYTSMLQASRSILADSGVKGLFQGFTATAIRDAPYAGLYVLAYEESKSVCAKLLSVRPDWDVPSSVIHSLSGITAATLATLATAPADCIKTKMQVLPAQHSTFRTSLATIYREHGLHGFFSGVSLRIVRKGASSAIGWSVYEGMLLSFRDRSDAKKRREEGI